MNGGGRRRCPAPPLSCILQKFMVWFNTNSLADTINTIAQKLVKVSKLVQRKLIPYRSMIGLDACRKVKYFGDISRQLLCI